jgi:diphosphomevalonate decarboxylase
MTLATARTETRAKLLPHEGTSEVWLAKTPTSQLERVLSGKAERHLAFLRETLGFNQALHIESRNTFPTGAGIASSASGLGALTLAAIAAWTGSNSLGALAMTGFPLERLSSLARLGSGSAGRSFFPGFVSWRAGEQPSEQSIRMLAGQDHWDLTDTIVVVAKEEKVVSSTDGHRAAWTSPLFLPRLASLAERQSRVEQAIRNRNLKDLGEALEAEALEMHSVMMTSEPVIRYLTKESFEVITWIRKMRTEGLRAYFTIDAGPNIHVIAEKHETPQIIDALTAAFPQAMIIADHVGAGPTLSREMA